MARNFRAAVNPHILDDRVTTIQVFRCPRCRRDLPESQFSPLQRQKYRHFLYLHPICLLCRQQMRSRHTTNALYTPALHRNATNLARSMRPGARARGIVVAIDGDDVMERFFNQNGLCALSGEPLKYGGSYDKEHKFSIDRIDSSRNYTIDNIQLVTGRINLMKGDLPQGEFLRLCMKITAYALASQEDEETAAA